MKIKNTPVVVWFLILLFVSSAASIVVDGLVNITMSSHTAHIKALCDKQGADYLEIGNEKLCVKEIR